MPSDDVHRIMKAVADRCFLGLTKQPAFGVRGLYGSIRITTGSPKEPYLPLKFVSAVPEELCDKLNLLVKEKKNREPDDLKMDQFFFLIVDLLIPTLMKKSKV